MFTVGWRDRHGEAGGVCAVGAGGWAAVGSLQTGSCGLRHQEAADQLCGGGRQGGNRLPGGGDHQVWGLRE